MNLSFILSVELTLRMRLALHAEAAIGLAIIVVYFRNSGTIRVEEIDKLKG